jgi:hypothetical protein
LGSVDEQLVGHGNGGCASLHHPRLLFTAQEQSIKQGETFLFFDTMLRYLLQIALMTTITLADCDPNDPACTPSPPLQSFGVALLNAFVAFFYTILYIITSLLLFLLYTPARWTTQLVLYFVPFGGFFFTAACLGVLGGGLAVWLAEEASRNLVDGKQSLQTPFKKRQRLDSRASMSTAWDMEDDEWMSVGSRSRLNSTFSDEGTTSKYLRMVHQERKLDTIQSEALGFFTRIGETNALGDAESDMLSVEEMQEIESMAAKGEHELRKRNIVKQEDL